MPTSERALDRGTRQGRRALGALSEEFRHARLVAGLSQQHVGDAARMSRAVYGRLEQGKMPHLSVVAAARIAAVLGLELSVRVYPAGEPLRDVGQATRLQRLLGQARAPLHVRTEVPLPRTTEHAELRSWDAILTGGGERTAVELETRLYDAQAQLRRIALKRRDDPTEHFLLGIADTRANRRVLREFEILFSDLPRLGLMTVRGALRAGRHPPTGLTLF